WWGNRPAIIGIMMIGIAVVGFATSLTIATVPRSGANKRFRVNPWSEVAIGLRRLSGDSGLVSAVAGITFFEFAGALVLLDLLLVGKEAMGLDDGSTASLGAFAGLGIGVGSVAAGQLSRGRIEIGLVPLGAMGVGIGLIILSVASVSYAMTACTLVLTGL